MNYLQIKKLADQLGLEVENELTWDEWDGWTVFIDAPEGQSFGGCQYHASSWVFPDEDKKLTKPKVWDLVANDMKMEAKELGPCHCGHWGEYN